MPYHLLVAEADQIQDFVHRSSRLREVVGASSLLSRLCAEVPDFLLQKRNLNAKVYVNSGGSVHARFDADADAKQFGADLAEIYRLALDGSLSVAETTPYDPAQPSPDPTKTPFQIANESADHKLRRAKRDQRTVTALAHLPYIAFCASCGIGLAEEHRQRFADNRAIYLCGSCRDKDYERSDERRLVDFIGKFMAEVARALETDAKGEVMKQLLAQPQQQRAYLDAIQRAAADVLRAGDPAERALDKFRFPAEADSLQHYDPRNYIAYLLADANDMGEAFGHCQSVTEVEQLSKNLTSTMRQSLAVPTAEMMRWQARRDDPRANPNKPLMPTLPLIMGGDDLFALLPAPWALHVALRFCQTFSQQIAQHIPTGVPTPTISAAVVVCKSNYPFAQAYDIGERALDRAKQLSKAQAAARGQAIATINFELILGSAIQTDTPSQKRSRPSVRSYWAASPQAEWSLPMQSLLDARYSLRDLPHKRMAELRALFEPSTIPMNENERVEKWLPRYRHLLRRIQQRVLLPEATLNALGGEQWLEISRVLDDDIWNGHALPDLLDMWDYAYSLDRPQRDYEEEAA